MVVQVVIKSLVGFRTKAQKIGVAVAPITNATSEETVEKISTEVLEVVAGRLVDLENLKEPILVLTGEAVSMPVFPVNLLDFYLEELLTTVFVAVKHERIVGINIDNITTSARIGKNEVIDNITIFYGADDNHPISVVHLVDHSVINRNVNRADKRRSI